MGIFYPIQWFANWLTYVVFGLQQKSVIGDAVNFFIYDSIKILLLLLIIIYLFAIIRTYLTPDKVKKFLSRKSFFGNIIAALIGIVTPFCSCSAVPLFIGFVEAGVPLGVTFSYLISAPMINEVAVILLFGLFGWKIAVLYVAAGLIIAIISGIILGKMKLEHLVQDYVWKIHVKNKSEAKNKTWKDRRHEAYLDTKSIVLKVYPWVLVGVALGAFIHSYAPENLLTQIAGKGVWYAVPLAVIIGVPLYSNAAGVLPIVQSLLEKGLPLGTALAFMMSVTALSLPEMIILRKVLKPKLLALYFGIVTFGIILVGYLFNLII
jgi:uncharacterized protein